MRGTGQLAAFGFGAPVQLWPLTFHTQVPWSDTRLWYQSLRCHFGTLAFRTSPSVGTALPADLATPDLGPGKRARVSTVWYTAGAWPLPNTQLERRGCVHSLPPVDELSGYFALERRSKVCKAACPRELRLPRTPWCGTALLKVSDRSESMLWLLQALRLCADASAREASIEHNPWLSVRLLVARCAPVDHLQNMCEHAGCPVWVSPKTPSAQAMAARSQSRA